MAVEKFASNMRCVSSAAWENNTRKARMLLFTCVAHFLNNTTWKKLEWKSFSHREKCLPAAFYLFNIFIFNGSRSVKRARQFNAKQRRNSNRGGRRKLIDCQKKPKMIQSKIQVPNVAFSIRLNIFRVGVNVSECDLFTHTWRHDRKEFRD